MSNICLTQQNLPQTRNRAVIYYFLVSLRDTSAFEEAKNLNDAMNIQSTYSLSVLISPFLHCQRELQQKCENCIINLSVGQTNSDIIHS